MTTLNLDTAEIIRHNWDDLQANHPEKIAQLRADGIIRLLTQATNIQAVLGRNYAGTVNIRSVFVFGPDDDPANIVGVHRNWIPIPDVAPDVVYQTVMVGMPLDPRIAAVIMEVNDGVMPEIAGPKEQLIQADDANQQE